jgi:hypothetical protein
MGHIRLGELPATLKWRDVVALLSENEPSIADLAQAVERAADRSLSEAVHDPGFVEALWLMLKIPAAAKSPDFVRELSKIGIRVPANPTVVDLLGGFDGALERARLRSGRAITDLSVLARNAAIAAFHSLIQERLPSMWAPTAEDERTTLATLGTTERFAELAQRFFTKLLEGHIQYYLDREIPKHISPAGFVHCIADTHRFDDAVRRHCIETTFIMRAFAKEWLGRNQFHLEKDISRADAAGFANYALTKIRNELSVRGVRQ